MSAVEFVLSVVAFFCAFLFSAFTVVFFLQYKMRLWMFRLGQFFDPVMQKVERWQEKQMFKLFLLKYRDAIDEAQSLLERSEKMPSCEKDARMLRNSLDFDEQRVVCDFDFFWHLRLLRAEVERQEKTNADET